MVVVMPFRKAHEVLRRRLGRGIVTVDGRVATDRAARYGTQLCAHLGRKVDARWDEAGTGRIRFDATSEVTLRATPEALDLVLTCPRHRREELQRVVSRHLESFGARDGLTTRWTTRK